MSAFRAAVICRSTAFTVTPMRWAVSAEINRPFAIGLAFIKSFTPYVSVDTARVYLHGGTAKPSRLASVGVGFRVSDAKYYSLDLSLAKPVGDAPVEGNGSRSPRVNAAAACHRTLQPFGARRL